MSRDSYVYFLYDRNNVVRYVGKGRYRRYKDYSNRSKEYKDIIDNGGESVIIIDKLSKDEAILIENKYLDLFKGKIHEGFNLINKMGSRRDPSPLRYKEVSEIFYTDENNFPYLRYKNTVMSGKRLTIFATKAGELVYCDPDRKSPYSSIKVNGKHYGIHRVIWVMFNKADLDPHLVVDHIDSNPFNNHPSNLQAITPQENVRKATTKSEFKGVTKPTSKKRYYSAVWTIDGKQYNKYFSLQKYGDELAFKLACEYRLKMVNLHYN